MSHNRTHNYVHELQAPYSPRPFWFGWRSLPQSWGSNGGGKKGRKIVNWAILLKREGWDQYWRGAKILSVQGQVNRICISSLCWILVHPWFRRCTECPNLVISKTSDSISGLETIILYVSTELRKLLPLTCTETCSSYTSPKTSITGTVCLAQIAP